MTYSNRNKSVSRLFALEKNRHDGKRVGFEQKERRQKNELFKKSIEEQLLKFLARLPFFIYLVDFQVRSIYDIITSPEPMLFEEVCGITVDEFKILCESGILNREEINGAIRQFSLLELQSRHYTRIDEQKSRPTGNTKLIVSRDEFEGNYEDWD